MNFRQPNEDLFNSTKMSFGEHLEELRKVLFKCLIWIAIGCAFGFWLANPVVKILTGPLVDAIAEYNEAEAADELIAEYGHIPPELRPWLETEKFVPRRMRVDPAQLVAALQTVLPDLATKVKLDPYGFQPASFLADRLPELCSQLAQTDALPGLMQSRRKLVWNALSPVEQATIKELATRSKTNPGDTEKMTQIFNRISVDVELYNAAEFANEVTEPTASFWSQFNPPAVKPLAKMKSQLVKANDANLARRLNRALLTDLFSDRMAELRMDLVAIEFWESSDFQAQSLGVSEPFMVWMKAGVLTGLVFSGPFIFYHLWSFVAAGLYPHEQKYVHMFLPISIGLFVAGVLLAFFFVFQPVLDFLFSFNRQMGISPQMRINDWISFVMFMPLGFGIAFQLPLVMLFMNRIGLFQVADYLNKWRIAVMVIFVVSMLLTPADPISMLLMALPLTLLYFLGIAMCQWMPRPQNPFAEPDREYTSS